MQDAPVAVINKAAAEQWIGDWISGQWHTLVPALVGIVSAHFVNAIISILIPHTDGTGKLAPRDGFHTVSVFWKNRGDRSSDYLP